MVKTRNKRIRWFLERRNGDNGDGGVFKFAAVREFKTVGEETIIFFLSFEKGERLLTWLPLATSLVFRILMFTNQLPSDYIFNSTK